MIALILAEGFRVGYEHGDGFGGVDGTAAAKRDNRVALFADENPEAVAHIRVGGIRLHAGKERHPDAGALHRAHENLGEAGAFHEGIGNQQDAARAESGELRREFARGAGTGDERGGDVELGDHVPESPFTSPARGRSSCPNARARRVAACRTSRLRCLGRAGRQRTTGSSPRTRTAPSAPARRC